MFLVTINSDYYYFMSENTIALIEENICIYLFLTDCTQYHFFENQNFNIKLFQFGQLSREHFSSLIFNTISENLTIFLGKA